MIMAIINTFFLERLTLKLVLAYLATAVELMFLLIYGGMKVFMKTTLGFIIFFYRNNYYKSLKFIKTFSYPLRLAIIDNNHNII